MIGVTQLTCQGAGSVENVKRVNIHVVVPQKVEINLYHEYDVKTPLVADEVF